MVVSDQLNGPYSDPYADPYKRKENLEDPDFKLVGLIFGRSVIGDP